MRIQSVSRRERKFWCRSHSLKKWESSGIYQKFEETSETVLFTVAFILTRVVKKAVNVILWRSTAYLEERVSWSHPLDSISKSASKRMFSLRLLCTCILWVDGIIGIVYNNWSYNNCNNCSIIEYVGLL